MTVAFHEFIVFGTLGKANFVSIAVFVLVNAPLLVVQRGGILSKNSLNLLFWLTFLVLGQPLSVLLCYYQVYDKEAVELDSGFNFLKSGAGGQAGIPPESLKLL